jgi:prephenate dehydratase
MPERAQDNTSRTVAIQGERGSFSHAAVLELLGTDWMPQPHATFDSAFQAVASGKAARALIPVENSLAGSIHENYDRLSALPLHIIGETQLRIRQCLIARPGSTLGVIRRVASHPVALAQCRNFFAERPNVEAIATYDTAGSVMDLLRDGPATQAAIGPALAASLYGGQILLESIEDDPENYTRFLLLAREPVDAGPASKTSIVFTTKNVPGALYRALGAFATRGADLAKIESRPLRGRPWEYSFYLDVLGDPAGAVAEAIEELRGVSQEVRILGSYPAAAGALGNGTKTR